MLLSGGLLVALTQVADICSVPFLSAVAADEIGSVTLTFALARADILQATIGNRVSVATATASWQDWCGGSCRLRPFMMTETIVGSP